MTYRNRALLDLAHEAPCLLLPGQHECTGDSEPCHSDMLRHGRGEKHKSHDCFAPPGCHNAHMAFTRSNLGKEGYFQAWVEAMERYWLWLWVAGKIRLTDITQRAKDTAMEAPYCKICEHNHWARDPHILPADAPAEKRSKRQVAALLAPPATSEPNTSREGRDVLKAQATSSDRDHLKAQPATANPGKTAGAKGTAEKPPLGKRKTAPKATKAKERKK